MKSKDILHQIQKNFKEILNLSYPLCKHDNKEISKLSSKINKDCYDKVKEISRLREEQNDSSIRDILLKNVNGFNPLN